MTPENLFFTSDTHFGHKKMLEIRPTFKDIEEHDEWLIARWNSTVPANGVVFHLGDVSFASNGRTLEILQRLNGSIYLVKGNHDGLNSKIRDRFVWVKDYAEINVEYTPSWWQTREKVKQHIVLCHYAFQVWNKSHHGSWHLHGHSHNNLAPSGKRMDVGIDVPHEGGFAINYRPFRFSEIAARLENVSFIAHDHHDERNPG